MPQNPYRPPSIPKARAIMPFDPNRNTRLMPWASEGMTLGAVMRMAMKPLPLMFVRHSAQATKSARQSEIAVAVDATKAELRQAEAKRSEENTSRAAGSSRPANIPKSGSTAAKRKNSAKTTRTAFIFPKNRMRLP